MTMIARGLRAFSVSRLSRGTVRTSSPVKIGHVVREPGLQPVKRLPPQHRRQGDRADQGRAEPVDLPELQRGRGVPMQAAPDVTLW